MKDDNNGYPKFQWSMFASVGRSEQYVVRAETLDELKKGIEAVVMHLNPPDPDWIDKDDELVSESRKIAQQRLDETIGGEKK